jgi:hypothetical protein
MKELFKRPAFQAGIIFALACVLGLTVFQRELNINGDNSAYITFGRSIAAGEGIRLISHPDKLESHYPILFPIFLGIIIKLFGFHLALLKASVLLLFGASSAIFFFIARRLFGGRFLWAILVLQLTNTWLLENATIVMSEIPFMGVILAGYLFIQRHEENQNGRDLILAILFLVSSVFIRTIGIAAFLTLLFYLGYRRKFRFLTFSLVLFFVLYPINKSFLGTEAQYLSKFFLANPYDESLGRIGLAGFFRRIGYNMVFYMGNVVQMTLFAFMEELGKLDNTANIILAVSFLGVLLAYPASPLSAPASHLFMRLFVMAYLAVLFIWPEVWSGSRFIGPIIPFFYLVAFQNVHLCVRRFLAAGYQARIEKILLVVAVVWALMNYSTAFRRVRVPLPDEWKDFYALAEWSKINTPPGAVFLSRKPILFYTKSDRLNVPTPYVQGLDAVGEYLEKHKVRYVVLDRFTWTSATQKYIVPYMQAHPEKFRQVFSIGKTGTALYEINAPGAVQ